MRKLLLISTFSLLISSPSFCQINWTKDFSKVLNSDGHVQDKAQLIYFTSKSCGPCKLLEKYVLSSEEFENFAKDYELVKVSDDGLQMNSEKYRDWKKLIKKYGITIYPSFVVLRKNKEIIRFLGNTTRDTDVFMATVRHHIR